MDIIVLKPSLAESELQVIVERLKSMGFDTKIVAGAERTIINVIGNTSKVSDEEADLFESMEGEDPNALIGLPLIRLVGWLNEAGIAVP